MPTATRFITRIQDANDFAEALTWASLQTFDAGIFLDSDTDGITLADAGDITIVGSGVGLVIDVGTHNGLTLTNTATGVGTYALQIPNGAWYAALDSVGANIRLFSLSSDDEVFIGSVDNPNGSGNVFIREAGNNVISSMSGDIGIGTILQAHRLQIEDGGDVVMKLGVPASGMGQIYSRGEGASPAYRDLRFIANTIIFRNSTTDEGSGSSDKMTIAHTSGDVGILVGNLVMTTGGKHLFRDAAIGMYSQADTFLDIFADGALRVGNSSAGAPTTYIAMEPGGDTFWVGSGSGLPYGEIFVQGNAVATTIGGTGVANKVQIVVFDSNGESNMMTPDHTNDHITVAKAGMYLVTISLTVNSVAGALAQFHFSLWRNNGATEATNIHAHRDLPAGAGGNAGVLSLSGICDCAAADTLELWVFNATNTQNLVINACTITAVMLGGT